MSKLDDQLKELQARKLKTEFFKLIKDNIEKIKSDQYKDVAKEVKDEVNAFIDAQIDMIESGTLNSTSELSALFDKEEVTVLKKIASRALGKKIVKESTPDVKQEPKKPREEAPTQDKISFALAHRHLGGKRVQIKDKGNGECVGLDAPYVVVKLDNGVTVEVKPEELII